MTTAYLETLRTNPVYAAAVRFIDKLVKAGVSLENIQASNFESRKGMTQGVTLKGPNKGLPNGKYVNRHVIVMPRGREGYAQDWKTYQDFRDRNVVEAIALGTLGLPQRGADGQTGIEATRTTKVRAQVA